MKVLVITSEWDLSPFIKRQVAALRNRRVTIDVFIFRGNKSPFQYLLAWIRLRRRYTLERYDFIHAHFGQSALLAMPLIKPLIVSFRGSDLLGIKNRNGKNTLLGFILKSWSRYAAKVAARVTVVSDEMALFLPDNIPYSILPSGVNLDIFKPLSSQACREQLNLPQDKKLILFGGRPERLDKRLSLAQEAINAISIRHNAALITMPTVSHEKVAEYINACDFVLLTSRQEGSPNIVKEALACNVPVISVDVGDVRSRISNISGCFVAESDSSVHIAEALERGLSSHQAIGGREAIQHLSEEKLIDQLMKIYQDVFDRAQT